MATIRRKSLYRPTFDVLEDRLAPAVINWDGSASNLWNNAANWDLNRAPLDGDDLVFPTGAANLTNQNNVSGLELNSVTFTGQGYVINGNAITLATAAGIVDDSGNGGANAFNLGLTLTATKTRIESTGAAHSLSLNGTLNLDGFRPSIGGTGTVNMIGVISGSGGITKHGTGNVALAGNNTYTGQTGISGGTLTVVSANALGSTAVGSHTVVSSDSTLQIGQDLILADEDITLRGVLTAIPGAAGNPNQCTLPGNILLTNVPSIQVSAGDRLDLTGAVSGSVGFTKTGDGTLRLAPAAALTNTYTGLTTVDGGILTVERLTSLGALGAGNETIVNANATLFIDTGLVEESLTLAGRVSSIGVNTAVTGDITLVGTALVEVTFDITDPPSSLEFSGVLSGAGGFTKAGLGTLRLSGPDSNTYTLPTTVNKGTLELAKSPGVTAVPGPFQIGDAFGGPDADVVRLFSPNQIFDTRSVAFASSGLLDLNGHDELVAFLNMTGGEVRTGAGKITVSNTIVATTDPTAVPAEINGKLQHGPAGYNVVDGPGGTELVIHAIISGAGLNKSGTGKLTLAGINTYTGITRVNEGTLAMGASGVLPFVPLEANATAVADLNGFDQLVRGLTGDGTVTNSSATLANLSVDVQNSSVRSFFGVLSGNLTLTKQGAGKQTFLGPNANSYTGSTVIRGGTLLLSKLAGVIALPDGTTAIDVTIGDDVGNPGTAVLELANPDQIADGAGVELETDGLLDLAGFNETIGSFQIGEGTLASTIPALLQVAALVDDPFPATLEFRLNGLAPDVSHSQIRSAGGVSLTDPTLDLQLGFVPNPGDSFTIIDKTSAGAVTGTFAGLPQGATFVDDGLRFQISYTGGNGNDVVVTRLHGPDIFVTAPERLAVPEVKVFDAASGALAYNFPAFSAGFDGGVRVAVADVNNDDFPDIIAGPGQQDAALGVTGIRIFNGLNGAPLPGALGSGFNPFGPSYIRGFFVAAGDFNSDGHADIVAGRNNASTTIKVVSGVDGTTQLASIENLFPSTGTYLKGVRLAVADVNGDGTPDIIATCGRRQEALLRVVDGTNFQPLAGPLGAGFHPFVDRPEVVQPLFIAAGDLDGDAKAEILVSIKNVHNTIRVFDQTAAKIRDFAGHPSAGYTGGMRVGVVDVNGDNRAEILIGTGKAVGLDPAVRCLDAATLAEIDAFFAYDQEELGIFVAGSV